MFLVPELQVALALVASRPMVLVLPLALWACLVTASVLLTLYGARCGCQPLAGFGVYMRCLHMPAHDPADAAAGKHETPHAAMRSLLLSKWQPPSHSPLCP